MNLPIRHPSAASICRSVTSTVLACFVGAATSQQQQSAPPPLLKPLPARQAPAPSITTTPIRPLAPAPVKPATTSTQKANTGIGPTGGATPQQASQMAQVRQYIDTLPRLPIFQPTNQPMPVPLPDSLRDAGYTATGGKVTDVVTHSKLYLFQPMSSVFWPGAVIQGRTIKGGQFSSIPLARGPGRIRLSGGFTAGTLARDLPETVNVDQTRIELLRSTGATDIASSSELQYVFARTFDDAAMKLGISYDGPAVSASLNAGMSAQSDQVMVVGRFTQAYYTASFEPLPIPGAPDSRPYLFSPKVTLQDIMTYANAGNASNPPNPPLYISDVKYGRIALISITSKGSMSEVQAALKGSYSNVKASLDARSKQIIENMSINVIQIGQTGQNMVNPVVVQNNETLKGALSKFIEQGARFNAQSNPGLPIEVTLKYVGSGAPDQVAAIQLTSEYLDIANIRPPVRECFTQQVWDGTGGGWQRAQFKGRPLYVNVGDKLEFNYRSGVNWSGVVATGDYDAKGWHTWDRPKDGELGYPITNASPFGFIGRLGSGSNNGEDPSMPGSKAPDAVHCSTQTGRNCSSAFWIGNSRAVTAGEAVNVQWGDLWLGTNDNNPTNGDPNKRWTIEICVQRKDYGPTSTRGAQPFNL